MRIAFVGIERKYQELPRDYWDTFDRFHLELPYYYARYGGNEVDIVTVDRDDERFTHFLDSKGNLTCVTKAVASHKQYDVVVHWRKWIDDQFHPEAVNLINCQDHSFGDQWKDTVRQRISDEKLRGVLCFPTWHKRNLSSEVGLAEKYLFDGVTLGVDIDIYRPFSNKDPYQMLWASDPGRGLLGALQLVDRLYRTDRRFTLNVCWPDYVGQDYPINHPAVKVHRNMRNGPELWDLFNLCGILPYTSIFMEPSSRAHRQAQAAGSLVLYPPGMGSPSELIESGKTGIVAPVQAWPSLIVDLVKSGDWEKIGQGARTMAVSESWEAQSHRFNALMKTLLKERR